MAGVVGDALFLAAKENIENLASFLTLTHFWLSPEIKVEGLDGTVYLPVC